MAQSVKYSMDEDLLIDADEYKRVYNKLSKETRNDLASFYGHEFDGIFHILYQSLPNPQIFDSLCAKSLISRI